VGRRFDLAHVAVIARAALIVVPQNTLAGDEADKAVFEGGRCQAMAPAPSKQAIR
jgi:hypothetical protein